MRKSLLVPNFIQKSVSLKTFNTWRVGGEADFFCQPRTEEEISAAYAWAQSEGYSVTVLGGGSNVLISDEGIQGLVICMKDFNKIESESVEDDHLTVCAQAGAKKAEVLKSFLKYNLPPALFLAGLPGDVAGGVVMNAGVSEAVVPREFFEIVDSFEVLKLNNERDTPSLKKEGLIKKSISSDIDEQTVTKVVYKNSEIKWAYRHSLGWQPGLILRVVMKWPMQPDPEIREKVRQASQVRMMKQPLTQPSCGSTFRNPSPQMSAGRLIDQAGLKGFRIGGAQVSEKHANFIVTQAGATAKDVSDVIEHIQKVILDKNQIQLQTEVVRLGKW
jgi:UDP-N-acetylmuramate dehydrogenase